MWGQHLHGDILGGGDQGGWRGGEGRSQEIERREEKGRIEGGGAKGEWEKSQETECKMGTYLGMDLEREPVAGIEYCHHGDTVCHGYCQHIENYAYHSISEEPDWSDSLL